MNHGQISIAAVRAPRRWRVPCVHLESRLHQLSPYIGKLKSSIASDLVRDFTSVGDLVLDPFCGSGTIPLECAVQSRRVLAADVSSYAVLLTRAKLFPPQSLDDGLERLELVLAAAKQRPSPDLRSIPLWVRRFFHPDTLKEAIRFSDACRDSGEDFLLACLLGILHHQRPGFLSYPSSHLVPYLRERNFPRDEYPELYRYRDVRSRMEKKIRRALSDAHGLHDANRGHIKVRRASIAELSLPGPIDAIVTSPPYMNALDYHRDNRLRLWFLEKSVHNYSPEPTDKRQAFRKMMRSLARRHVTRLKRGGRCVMIVGETVKRKGMTGHPAAEIADIFATECPDLRLVHSIKDVIPDVRRSRRAHSGTKRELILVFERE